MNAEITKEAFKHLVDQDTKCLHVEEKEHYRRETYKAFDCYLYVVENHLAGVKQYFIQDINV